MKKTDIAMIILIASLSVMVAYFVADSIPSLKDSRQPVTVKTADPISADISEPDPAVFNKNAINPTVEVIIGAGNQRQATSSSDNSTDQTPATQTEQGQ